MRVLKFQNSDHKPHTSCIPGLGLDLRWFDYWRAVICEIRKGEPKELQGTGITSTLEWAIGP